MPIDPSVLLQAQGIRLPDPVQYATQAMTLADLAGRRDLQKLALDAARRKEEQDNAIGGALGGLDVTNDQAVASVMQQLPPAARQGFAKYVMDQRKERADLGKTEAETNAKRADVKQKAMRDIANVAFEEAKNPNNLSLSRLKKVADFYGVELPQMPTDPRDVNGVAEYLTMLGNAGYDVKDRAAATETNRHNLTTEGATASRDAATAAHNAATLDQNTRHQRVMEGKGWARINADKSDRTKPSVQVGPNGELFSVDPVTGTGKPIVGPDGQPLTRGQSRAPEAYSKQVAGITNLNTAIQEYQAALKNWGNIDMVNPNARAEMGTKYNNMMLQAKEAYNLGVLNGPDYQILTSVVADPTKLGSAIISNDALSKQAGELGRIMEQNAQNLATVYKQTPPATSQPPAAGAPEPAPQKKAEAPSKPRLGEVRRGYLYKGGDPSSPSSWEKVKG